MGRISNYLFRPINRYMVRMVAGVLAVALLLWGSFVWGENQRRKQEEERVAITGEVSPDGTDQAVISDPTDSVLDQDNQDNPIDDSQDNQSNDSSDDASKDQQDQDDQSDDQIASTSQEEDNSSDSSGQVAGEQDSSTNGEQGDLNGDGAYTDNSKDVQPGERNALPSTGLAEFVSVVLPAIILSVLLYKNKEQADRLLSLKK